MESGANAAQVVADLWLSILKVLGRPAIQQQLLIGLLAIGPAWALAKWFNRRMQRREAMRLDAIRTEILTEAQVRIGEIDGRRAAETDELAVGPINGEVNREFEPQAPAETVGAGAVPEEDDRAYFATLLQDEEALQEAVRQRRGPRSGLLAVLEQTLFPLLAILFLYSGYVYAVSAGWYSGLIIDLTLLFGLFLLYRLALGIAYAFGNAQRIAFYQHRLFGPIVAVIILLLIINTVGDLAVVSSARIMALTQGWLTIGMLFAATFGFYVWIMSLSLIKDLIVVVVGRRPTVNAGSLEAGLTLIQYSLVAVGLFGVLRLLQVNTATVAAITGGLAIGVGLALQDVLKNFLGGIIVLFEGSVRPGDWVEIAGTEGAIDKLSIRSTVVRSFDNVEYIVPNQDWLNSTVTTFTRSSRLVRTRVPIGVSYDADPHEVQALLIETAARHPDVLAEPPPVAPLVEFGESSLNFLLLAWVADATIKGKVASELRMQIWDALTANGIEIPYPQQDIHIRSSSLSVDVSSIVPEAQPS